MISGIISIIATITLSVGVHTGDIEKMQPRASKDGLTPYQEGITELIKHYLGPMELIDMEKHFREEIEVDSMV